MHKSLQLPQASLQEFRQLILQECWHSFVQLILHADSHPVAHLEEHAPHWKLQPFTQDVQYDAH